MKKSRVTRLRDEENQPLRVYIPTPFQRPGDPIHFQKGVKVFLWKFRENQIIQTQNAKSLFSIRKYRRFPTFTSFPKNLLYISYVK
jgi:hypothetical protein